MEDLNGNIHYIWVCVCALRFSPLTSMNLNDLFFWMAEKNYQGEDELSGNLFFLVFWFLKNDFHLDMTSDIWRDGKRGKSYVLGYLEDFLLTWFSDFLACSATTVTTFLALSHWPDKPVGCQSSGVSSRPLNVCCFRMVRADGFPMENHVSHGKPEHGPCFFGMLLFIVLTYIQRNTELGYIRNHIIIYY